MTPLAQILVVFQNTLGNSGAGATRNRFEIEDVLDINIIKERVRTNLGKLANGGHVVVKWEGKLFVCEKNNVEPDKDYIRHEITYHPHQAKFTI